MVKVVATHKVIQWNESVLHEFPEEKKKLTKVSAKYEFVGDMIGEALVEYTLNYELVNAETPHLSSSNYVGYLRFTGTILNKEGSLVIEDNGKCADGVASSDLKIISGTQGLTDLKGTGWYKASMEGFFFELNLDDNSSGLSNREIAQNFLLETSSGNVAHAYENYVNKEKFVHHNPYFESDADSLQKGMEESYVKMPHKRFEIKQIVEEKNLISIHSSCFLHPEDKTGLSLIHIFSFECGKIVELWDIAMHLPEKMHNEKGAF